MNAAGAGACSREAELLLLLSIDFCLGGGSKGIGRSIALAFADTYRALNARISLFANLPIASLDKLSLKRRLDDIGQNQTQPAQ